MKRSFRKYHRILAIIVCLPLTVTVLTGMIVTIVREWFPGAGIPSSTLLSIHTGEILHLQAIYPMLNGLGIIGLLATGLSMTSLFGRKTQQNRRS